MCARDFMCFWGYVICGQDLEFIADVQLEFIADVQLDVHLGLCLAAYCRAGNLGV